MDNWIGTKHFVFCSDCNVTSLYRRSLTNNLQARYPLSSTVRFYVIYVTWQPLIEVARLSAAWGSGRQLCGLGPWNRHKLKLSISKFYENNVTHVKTEYKLWLQWIISSVYQAITEWSSLERICGGSMGPTHIVVYRFPRRQIGVPPQWGVVRLHILRKTWPWKTVGNVQNKTTWIDNLECKKKPSKLYTEMTELQGQTLLSVFKKKYGELDRNETFCLL
jgi:hypothetical protein